MIKSCDPKMKEVEAIIERISPTDLTVLLTGETGVGKEVIARSIVAKSPRVDRPFVKINCAVLPTSLMESELYGHSKGAFTGASDDRLGVVLQSNGGTLLIDEICEMDITGQAKLLHLIQDSEISALGTNTRIHLDVRYIAATNKNVLEEVKQGRFRRDLFHCLNVVHIHLPPLRERTEDIKPLAQYFLKKYEREFELEEDIELKEKDYEVMEKYPWPGNIRELENSIKNFVLLDNVELFLRKLHKQISRLNENSSSNLSLLEAKRMAEATVEKKIIQRVLERTGWDRRKTARLLKISYRSLLDRIKKLGIGIAASSEVERLGSSTFDIDGDSEYSSALRTV